MHGRVSCATQHGAAVHRLMDQHGPYIACAKVARHHAVVCPVSLDSMLVSVVLSIALSEPCSI